MGTAKTRGTACTHYQNENTNTESRKAQEKTELRMKQELQKFHLSTWSGHKNDYHGCKCDAKGGDPRNQKYTKYEGDRNKIQRTSKDEMARPAVE